MVKYVGLSKGCFRLKTEWARVSTAVGFWLEDSAEESGCNM